MPLYQLLTDRTLAQSSAITPTTLIHIVYTGDPSQNIAGSSYKAELGQLAGLFSGGSVSGDYLPLSGGTVSGATNFTNGLTANTISATTYLNLPLDIRVTGGTYSAGTITFTNNQNTTFPVTGLTQPFTGGTVTGSTNFTNGLTANTISATTYQNLPTDIRVTGATYSNNEFTYTNNTGGTYSVLFNTVTGLTVNGQLSVTGNTGLGTSSPSTRLDLSSLNTTTAVNNTLRFTDTDTSLVSGAQFNGKIEFYSNETSAVGVRSYIGGIINSTSQGSLIFGTTGATGSLTGGTTVGERMRIDSSGNVGIGTSSPSYKLDVNSGDFVIDEIAIRAVNNESTPKGVLIIPTADDDSYNYNTVSGDTVIVATGGRSLVIGAGGLGSGFRFSGTSTPTATSAVVTTGARLGIGASFYTPSEQPSTNIDVDGNARFRNIGSDPSAAALHYTLNGTLTIATSDIRLKENVEPLTNSLEKVLQLTGVTYSWIGQEGKRIGFIAQEVEKVIPELVFTNNNTEDKIKGIHLDNITAVLVEAIKEQQKIIEELKLRISNLES